MTTLTSSDQEILREAARAVHAAPTPRTNSMDARTAARILSGVARYIATTHGMTAMQHAFATLAQVETVRSSAELDEPVKLLSVTALGILPLAGRDNLRSALAFWAVATPIEWSDVAA